MKSRIVLADGCFDPLHSGHLRYLTFAAQHGSVLVRVAPDGVIRAKGRQPFFRQAERVQHLAALRMVDAVVAGEDDDGDDLSAVIRHYRPSALVKGAEWEGHLPADVVQACEDLKTELIFYRGSLTERHSTERLAG